MSAPQTPRAPPPPLDPSLYHIEKEQADFLKAQIGISTDEELKEHILAIQAKAYEVHMFGCIRLFSFLRLSISKLPVYQRILELGKSHKDAILLDLGCFFGVETRKAAADGFPNVIGVDLYPEYLELGRELFKEGASRPTPVHLIAGDLLKSDFLEATSLATSPPTDPSPNLDSLTSLNPLHGRVSVIYIAAVFHLFDEQTQVQLARAVASLLSPLPGSMICGWQIGVPEIGYPIEAFRTIGYCHTVKTWAALWNEQVFEKGTVKVDAYLMKVDKNKGDHVLVWSVTRL